MSMTRVCEQAATLLLAAQDIATIIAQQQEKPLLLAQTLERLVQACDAPHGAVFLRDAFEESTELTMAAVIGAGVDDSPLRHLAEHVRRAIDDDVYAATQMPHTLGVIQAYAMAPLRHAGVIHGAIVLGYTTLEVEPASAQVLRLVGDILASAVCAIDLQAKLATAQHLLEIQRAQLQHTTSIDTLTGLLNRQAFTEKIAPAVEKAQQGDGQLSLLMIDTDHLKLLNDHFGTQAGDEALRRIAEVVQGGIRGWDVAARFGGDEFAVLLPSTGGIGAVAVAERLRDQISSLLFGPEGHRLSLTACIGVSCLSSHITNVEALLVKADQCLFEGKTYGGNQVIIDWDQALEGVDEE